MNFGSLKLPSYDTDLDVFSPFCLAIVFGDFRLEQVITSHGGGQTSQGLTPTTAHAHQQSVTARNTQDSTNTGQMFQYISKR